MKNYKRKIFEIIFFISMVSFSLEAVRKTGCCCFPKNMRQKMAQRLPESEAQKKRCDLGFKVVFAALGALLEKVSDTSSN